LVHIRSILNNVGATVLPDQVAIAKAQEAIDERGSLKDPKQQEAVEALGRTLARFVGKLIA
jgi:chromate reductase